MTEKFSYDFVENFFYQNGYTLLNKEYIFIFDRLTFQDSDGYLYYLSFANFRKGILTHKDYVPERFHTSNVYTLKNIKLWIYTNNCPFELIGGEYKGNNKRTLYFKCGDIGCGEVWDGTWDTIQNGVGCSFCAGYRVGKYNNVAYLFPNLLEEWDYDRNKVTPDKVTKGDELKVWWICKKCSHNWQTYIFNRTAHESGCPMCNLNLSKGNRNIISTIFA